MRPHHSKHSEHKSVATMADCNDAAHSHGNHRPQVSLSNIMKPLLGMMMLKSLLGAMMKSQSSQVQETESSSHKLHIKNSGNQITFE